MKQITRFMILALLLLSCCLATAAEPLSQTGEPETVFAIDLTPLFQAVIAVIAALISYRLLPWIKSRTSQVQQERMEAVIRTLVYAAQQLYKTGEIQDRLAYVQQGLQVRGFAIDRDAIEAAVRQLNLEDGILALPSLQGESDF